MKGQLSEHSDTHAAGLSVDPALLARAAAALWAMAASLALIWVLGVPHPAAPQPPADNQPILFGIILVAYAAAGVVLALPEHLFLRLSPLGLAMGTVLATLGIHFGDQDVGVVYYGFAAVWASYFLIRWQAVLEIAFMGLCYASTLLIREPLATSVARWLITMATLALVCVLVWNLRRRFERLIVRLAETARTDSLTGLLNRRGFQDAFDFELERTRRRGGDLSLLICDLDRFKQVNDRLGHRAGDQVLERLGDVLEHRKRRIDSVARIGGEEFALILPGANAEGAHVMAERLRREVEQSFQDVSVPLTISVGVASLPQRGASAQVLLAAADQALYAAKALGRNRVAVHNTNAPGTPVREHTVPAEDDSRTTNVLRLADTLGIRDAQTAARCERIARYAECAARQLGLAEAATERVRFAGVLRGLDTAEPHHFAPGTGTGEARRLDAEPLASIGRDPLRKRELGRQRPTALSSEEGERMYGSTLEARILTVAEAYEALTDGYRPAGSALVLERAAERLRQGAGDRLDQQVVEAFLQSIGCERDEQVQAFRSV